MLSAGSHFQPHTGVLPVVKGLNIEASVSISQKPYLNITASRTVSKIKRYINSVNYHVPSNMESSSKY